mmetsp:Transcript_30821/g.86014  ORF Transcript_30821/g.86014 Transcript_30821/m.86014 type:complete len:149 (+) Transcript_30821:385-831(+)
MPAEVAPHQLDGGARRARADVLAMSRMPMPQLVREVCRHLAVRVRRLPWLAELRELQLDQLQSLLEKLGVRMMAIQSRPRMSAKVLRIVRNDTAQQLRLEGYLASMRRIGAVPPEAYAQALTAGACPELVQRAVAARALQSLHELTSG